MNYAEWLKWRDKYFKMQKMTFEEWLIKNEEELNIKFAETGMDRELDFDVEYDMSSKGITIGNAIDKSGSIEPRQRAVGNEKKRKRISKKQQAANEKRFLDDFRSEAGTSRTK